MLSELNKICSQVHIKLLIIIALLVSIIIPIFLVGRFSTNVAIDSVDKVEGKEAIKILKERYNNSNGELTEEKLNEVLFYYKMFGNEEIAILNTSVEYPGITNLLLDAYTSLNPNENISLFSLENANKFYDRNVIILLDVLDRAVNKYKPWEEEIIIEKAKGINNPYYVEFSKQWVFIFKLMSILSFMLGGIAIISGANLFSYEKEKNMELILITLNKRSLKDIARNKLKAFFSFLTILYIGSITISSTIFLSQVGVSAFNSPIQLEYFSSIYNITFGEAYFMCIFIGLISVLAVGTIVALINMCSQKRETSLFLTTVFVFVPLIIVKLSTMPITIKRFFLVQPANGLSADRVLRSLNIFKIINFDILSAGAVVLCSIGVVIIGVFIMPNLFKSKLKIM